MRKLLIFWFSCLCLLSTAAIAQPRQKVFTGMVESLKDAYNNHSYKTIHLLMTPTFAKELPLARMTSFFDGIHGQMGNWTSFTQKSLNATTGVAQYVAHFQKGDADFTLEMDKEDVIKGMLFKPIPGSMLKNADVAMEEEPGAAPVEVAMDPKTEATGEEMPEGISAKMTEEERDQLMSSGQARQDNGAETPTSNQEAARQRPKTPRAAIQAAAIVVVEAKSALMWPFAPGESYSVMWGGTNPDQNAHSAVPEQRFALDLVQRNATGTTFNGDGKKNTDYVIYGQKVRSSTAGTVVRVIKGVPENTPGQLNPYQVTGNTVIVQTPEGEFVLYAHLQTKSIKLKEGKKVKAGKTIGTVGNSGNSTEPHLHFQVMTQADLQKSECLLPNFKDVARVANNADAGTPKTQAETGDLLKATK